MKTAYVLTILGVLSLAWGLAELSSSDLALRPIADAALANLKVAAADSESNKQCKEPVRDCDDHQHSCKASGQTQCVHIDAWTFSEDEYCIHSEGSTCNKTDYQNCYEKVTCTKNPHASCDTTWYCGSRHSPCNTQIFKAYDDCNTT